MGRHKREDVRVLHNSVIMQGKPQKGKYFVRPA